jgi:hypothetical protein
MNLVSFALRRPVTVLVSVVAAVLTGVMAVARMQRDVFPDLGVPTLYVAQPYGGLDPAQMEGFLTNYYEYHLLYINGIEHAESKNIQGAEGPVTRQRDTATGTRAGGDAALAESPHPGNTLVLIHRPSRAFFA